jgi:hypothetical protein
MGYSESKQKIFLSYLLDHAVIITFPCSRTPLAPRITREQENHSTHSDFRKDNVRADRADSLRLDPLRMGGVGGPVEATALGDASQQWMNLEDSELITGDRSIQAVRTRPGRAARMACRNGAPIDPRARPANTLISAT